MGTAVHIRTWLWEALLRIAALLGITLLWETLLWITALLWIALLRIAALLWIALLRENALLWITLLLWEAALLLWIASLLLLLNCIKSGEAACSLLLSIIWLLIEEVEVFTLLLRSFAASRVAGERISRINIESVCEISRSTELRSGSLCIIISAEEIRSRICGNETCCGNSLLR